MPNNLNDYNQELELFGSYEKFRLLQRRDKSEPRVNTDSSLSRGRNIPNYFMGTGTSTYENRQRDKERKERNQLYGGFLKEVKRKRGCNNLEENLQQLYNGFNSFLSNNQEIDIIDKISILLDQSDALFEKLLEHL